MTRAQKRASINKIPEYILPLFLGFLNKNWNKGVRMFNKNNDYLNKFSEALQLCAFAGDTRNAKILWLSSFTRHSNTPVSVLIKGSPGSGKSHLLNTVLKFIPEDEYKSFTGISEKAIAYMGKYSLKNKILAIQEFS